MAYVAETLKVCKVESRAALVDWSDMIDHLCRSRHASLFALLT